MRAFILFCKRDAEIGVKDVVRFEYKRPWKPKEVFEKEKIVMYEVSNG